MSYPGSATQARSNILKTGTGFDAQKQFLANIEDAIASPVDIPGSIARYQKTLGYASTPLDFVCGIGLYLMPSDMALHPGNVQGYNNEIQIAGLDAAIGYNPGINEAEPFNPASKGNKAFQGKTASPGGTIHKGPQPSQFLRNKTNDDGTSARSSGTPAGRSYGTPAGVPEERQSDGQATAHEEEINGPRGNWDSSWPSGALVIVSLASPEQPRETGEPSRGVSQRAQEPRDN